MNYERSMATRSAKHRTQTEKKGGFRGNYPDELLFRQS